MPGIPIRLCQPAINADGQYIAFTSDADDSLGVIGAIPAGSAGQENGPMAARATPPHGFSVTSRTNTRRGAR